MIEAEIILDSINTSGNRLTTMRCRYPKWIHGELMTHRVFSRNASSSRAIPTSKYVEEASTWDLMARPVFWGANQKGMQAVEECNNFVIDPVTGENLSRKDAWLRMGQQSAAWGKAWSVAGYHKQQVNRSMEPYVHINVLITSTEWLNFFGLRLDAAAQPEMLALAEKIWEAYNESKPTLLYSNEWHRPYYDPDLDYAAVERHVDNVTNGPSREAVRAVTKNRVSAARCARISYTSFETGKRSTVAEDLGLFSRLLEAQPLHASPAEHQARPDVYDSHGWANPKLWGNFKGWIQFRQLLDGQAVAPLPEGYKLNKENLR